MKRFLISLFVCLFGLVSFGYCSDLVFGGGAQSSIRTTLKIRPNETGYYNATLLPYSSVVFQYLRNTLTCSYSGFVFTGGEANLRYSIYNNSSTSLSLDVACFANGGDEGVYQNIYFYNVPNLYGSSISSCPDCPVCEECQECQECSYSGYILESEIDTNYCVGNGLCPSQEFSGFSNLYVNDILFMPSAIYDLTIPEEFDFDYTGNSDLLSIDIKGYNTDSDYIAGIISTQNNYPNDSYFNSIVSDLIPKLVPGLVIILFLYFVFRFIKKIF